MVEKRHIMSNLQKLVSVLRQLDSTHNYPYNYTIPELWDCDKVKTDPKQEIGNGEILVNPYRFYADIIEQSILDKIGKQEVLCEPYYLKTNCPSNLKNGNWIHQSFAYSCMIRTSSSWDHDRNGVLESNNMYSLKETGTFVKTLALLPLLKKMGIDVLYMLPILKYSLKDKKGELGSPYGVSNFYQLDEGLKDPLTEEFMSVEEEFKALVEACHILDIKVIIDIIPRTNSVNSDLIIDHPEWFYWIDLADLADYKPPFVPGIQAGSVARQEYLPLIYSSSEVLQHIRKFRKNPKELDLEKWSLLCKKWKKGKGKYNVLDLVQSTYSMTIAPAFSDCINDPQPAWSDVTFFRMYMDHPYASQRYLPETEEMNPYILFDVAKSSLNPGKVINQPLWDMLENIIPYYQQEFGIDGARIDMGHALPLELVQGIIKHAREIDPNFCFIAEELDCANAQSSVDKGYNMIIGDGFLCETRPQEDKLNAFAYSALNLPCPVFASGETHDTPRLAARPGKEELSTMLTLLNCFIPNSVPFLNSGQEVYEVQPMNTGLDCREDEQFQLDKSDPFYGKLALFDRYAFHYNHPNRWLLPTLLEEVLKIRKKYLPVMLKKENIIPMGFSGPWDPALGFGYCAKKSMIFVIANHDLEKAHHQLIRLDNLPEIFLAQQTTAKLIFSSQKHESYLHFENQTLTTEFLPGEVKIFEITL